MTQPRKTLILNTLLMGLLLVPVLLLNSCSTTDAPATNDSAVQSEQTQPEQTTSGETPSGETVAVKESVKFKQDGGQERFTLKYKSDGAKLEEASGAEIARLKIDATQKVKIKDAQDTVLGYVVPTTGAWKLENAEQSEELYILRQQDDGDYKLETGGDQPIYRIKKRDYGFEIESPEKQSLYKIKVKEGKTSLRNADDTTVLYSKDKVSPIAMAAFGFDVLKPEQQAALAYAVSQSTP